MDMSINGQVFAKPQIVHILDFGDWEQVAQVANIAARRRWHPWEQVDQVGDIAGGVIK